MVRIAITEIVAKMAKFSKALMAKKKRMSTASMPAFDTEAIKAVTGAGAPW